MASGALCFFDKNIEASFSRCLFIRNLVIYIITNNATTFLITVAISFITLLRFRMVEIDIYGIFIYLLEITNYNCLRISDIMEFFIISNNEQASQKSLSIFWLVVASLFF